MNFKKHISRILACSLITSFLPIGFVNGSENNLIEDPKNEIDGKQQLVELNRFSLVKQDTQKKRKNCEEKCVICERDLSSSSEEETEILEFNNSVDMIKSLPSSKTGNKSSLVIHLPCGHYMHLYCLCLRAKVGKLECVGCEKDKQQADDNNKEATAELLKKICEELRKIQQNTDENKNVIDKRTLLIISVTILASLLSREKVTVNVYSNGKTPTVENLRAF